MQEHQNLSIGEHYHKWKRIDRLTLKTIKVKYYDGLKSVKARNVSLTKKQYELFYLSYLILTYFF